MATFLGVRQRFFNFIDLSMFPHLLLAITRYSYSGQVGMFHALAKKCEGMCMIVGNTSFSLLIGQCVKYLYKKCQQFPHYC